MVESSYFKRRRKSRRSSHFPHQAKEAEGKETKYGAFLIERRNQIGNLQWVRRGRAPGTPPLTGDDGCGVVVVELVDDVIVHVELDGFDGAREVVEEHGSSPSEAATARSVLLQLWRCAAQAILSDVVPAAVARLLRRRRPRTRHHSSAAESISRFTKKKEEEEGENRGFSPVTRPQDKGWCF